MIEFIFRYSWGSMVTASDGLQIDSIPLLYIEYRVRVIDTIVILVSIRNIWLKKGMKWNKMKMIIRCNRLKYDEIIHKILLIRISIRNTIMFVFLLVQESILVKHFQDWAGKNSGIYNTRMPIASDRFKTTFLFFFFFLSFSFRSSMDDQDKRVCF